MHTLITRPTSQISNTTFSQETLLPRQSSVHSSPHTVLATSPSIPFQFFQSIHSFDHFTSHLCQNHTHHFHSVTVKLLTFQYHMLYRQRDLVSWCQYYNKERLEHLVSRRRTFMASSSQKSVRLSCLSFIIIVFASRPYKGSEAPSPALYVYCITVNSHFLSRIEDLAGIDIFH